MNDIFIKCSKVTKLEGRATMPNNSVDVVSSWGAGTVGSNQKSLKRGFKTITWRQIHVGGTNSRRPPIINLVWAEKWCGTSTLTVATSSCKTLVLKLELYHNHLEGLLPYSWLGPIPRVSDSVGLTWSWRIYIWASSQMMPMPLLWASYMETTALEEQLLLKDREIPVISWSIEADWGPTLSVRTKARGMGRILATRQY